MEMMEYCVFPRLFLRQDLIRIDIIFGLHGAGVCNTPLLYWGLSSDLLIIILVHPLIHSILALSPNLGTSSHPFNPGSFPKS